MSNCWSLLTHMPFSHHHHARSSLHLPILSSPQPSCRLHLSAASFKSTPLTLRALFHPWRFLIQGWDSQGKCCKAFSSKATDSDVLGSVECENDGKREHKKLAIFISGGGSNFRALYQATLQNAINAEIVLVVSDKPGCKGCDYAKQHGILVISYPEGISAPHGVSPIELVQTLRYHGVDYVLLAGYLKLLPEELVQAYPRSILNIHPALLPAFGGKGYYGRKVHEAVIKSGARYSGPTIHFVDEKYDHGPILAQRVVQILPTDSPDDLASKVLREEHELYVEAAAALCEGRIFWREDGVPMIRKLLKKDEYY